MCEGHRWSRQKKNAHGKGRKRGREVYRSCDVQGKKLRCDFSVANKRGLDDLVGEGDRHWGEEQGGFCSGRTRGLFR